MTPKTEKGGDYHVSDLPEGAVPDPLGDAKLTPAERATAGTEKPAESKPGA
jgi:hypothetical protein